VKAPPRRRDREPGGAKSQEGIELDRRLTAVEQATDPHPEQGPVGGVTRCGAGGQPSAAARRQRREGTATDEVVRLGVERKPWRENPGRGCGVK